MQIVATQKNVRQSPRKVRLVANTVKKLSLTDALRQLAVIERRSTLVVLKVLKQAIANAMNNHQLSFESLNLKSIEVVPGPTYKRFQPVSRGRAHSIYKRTSHVRVVLETKDTVADQETKPAAAEKVAGPDKTETKATKPAAKKSVKNPTVKSTTAKNTAPKKSVVKPSMNKGKTK